MGFKIEVPVASLTTDSHVIWDNAGMLGLIPRVVMLNGIQLTKDTGAKSFTVYWEQVYPISWRKLPGFFGLLINEQSNNSTNQGQDNTNPATE